MRVGVAFRVQFGVRTRFRVGVRGDALGLFLIIDTEQVQAHMEPTSPGPYATLILTSPGPHVTLMLTSPGPHGILAWQNALVSYSALTPSAVMVGGGDDQPADCRLEMCLGPSFDLQQVEFIESSQRLRIKLPKKTGKMKPLRLQVQKIRGD